ncbi:MAG: ferrochelatase [Gammaproteobacteria bacterium]|nr:ferrochelatase [Gammaproteobacteria bacterium]
MDSNKSFALILVNLGTPDSPDEEDIRRWLKQFLSDPRVVDFPRWLWLPILNRIILKTRPKKLVENYSMIWGKTAGPIVENTLALAEKIQKLMPGNINVIPAMTYGNPSIPKAFEEAKSCDEIIVLPLLPQYTGATTGAIQDQIIPLADTLDSDKPTKIINNYHDDPGYIAAIAETIIQSESFRKETPKLIFSFHGIPQSQSKRGDPYEKQCAKTAKMIANKLELEQNQWKMTFQSRFGPFPWLKPYTDRTMKELPGEGIENVLVVCPGFSTDCLETIEEIEIQNREFFLAAGGKSFSYVKALNDSDAHAELLRRIVLRNLAN